MRARFCNECGSKLEEWRALREENGRVKLHADIAHPINSRCRLSIQDVVLKAYHRELELSKYPGYVCSYDWFKDDTDDPAEVDEENLHPTLPRPHAAFQSITVQAQKP